MRFRAACVLLPVALAIASAHAKDAALYKVEDCSKFIAQMDLNSCTGDNLESADAALNAVYKQVMVWRDKAGQESLKHSERAWIAQRDKTCADEVGPQEDGGSIWPMESNTCLREQTDKRIRELQKMMTCKAGVSVCNPH